MELHEKIKALRKRRNYLQKDVADQMGLTEQSYARMENGKYKDLKIAKVEQIAVILDTKPYILMDNTSAALTLDEWLNLTNSAKKDSENSIADLHKEIDNLKERLAASVKKQQLQEQLLKTYQSILKDYLSTSKTIEVWSETYAKKLIRISQEKEVKLKEATELMEKYEQMENQETENQEPNNAA